MQKRNTRRGFTLIELLVVVLIIGILAAVAVPQYQKAVMRSRFATMKNWVHSIADAQEIYYLAHNEYANDFDKLDVDVPASTVEHEYEEDIDANIADKHNRYYDWGHCYTLPSASACYNNDMGYYVFHNHSTRPNRRRCTAVVSDSPASQICQSETGDKAPVKDADGYMHFWYQ